MSRSDYHVDWTKFGSIRCWFWQANNVHPWDLMMEIEWTCQEKYPDFALTEVRRQFVLNPNGVETSRWTMLFQKKKGCK